MTAPAELRDQVYDGPESVYEPRYQMLKDAAFELYRWGLRTDNDDAIEFHKQMHRLYRTYDKKFRKPTVNEE